MPMVPERTSLTDSDQNPQSRSGAFRLHDGLLYVGRMKPVEIGDANTAFMRLFLDRRGHDVAVRDVMRELGISNAAFYNKKDRVSGALRISFGNAFALRPGNSRGTWTFDPPEEQTAASDMPEPVFAGAEAAPRRAQAGDGPHKDGADLPESILRPSRPSNAWPARGKDSGPPLIWDREYHEKKRAARPERNFTIPYGLPHARKARKALFDAGLITKDELRRRSK